MRILHVTDLSEGKARRSDVKISATTLGESSVMSVYDAYVVIGVQCKCVVNEWLQIQEGREARKEEEGRRREE